MHKTKQQLGIGIVTDDKIPNVNNNNQNKAKEEWAMVHWKHYPHLSKPREYEIEDLVVIPKNALSNERKERYIHSGGGRRRTMKRRGSRRSRSYRKK